MKRYFIDLLWDEGLENILDHLLNAGFVLFAVLWGFYLYDGLNIFPRLDPMLGCSIAFVGIGFIGCLSLFVLRIIFRKHKPEE